MEIELRGQRFSVFLHAGDKPDYGLSDVNLSLFPCPTLRVAPGQAWTTGHDKTVFVLFEYHIYLVHIKPLWMSTVQFNTLWRVMGTVFVPLV